ncbi:MAG: hypothetical protein DYG93_05560 [Leptolyngbya sp. PLA2]|nr:hypothetical protein [Leptolyngbya sp.]MCE7971115.1 hypothetical protein [Leptolyngbya sp. PL-A2]MCQ3940794.1 hypothetical protein [cyanobacterium CYA1]GIK19344.1 MAG: hypothetical protein BroJett004_15080 [Planctomycetota bacterium]
MADMPPSVVILAGPNGAGKTTAAPFVLRDALGVDEFVNADDIARGLSGFAPERSAVAAGRIMLARMRELAGVRATFAFETTLATRSYAPWLSRMRQTGYRATLVFLSLPSADAAVERVRGRVAEGGHDVPEPVVRRRYARGLRNLWNLYLPLADDWSVYDNAGRTPDLMAVGSGMIVERVVLQSQWKRLRGGCGDE